MLKQYRKKMPPRFLRLKIKTILPIFLILAGASAIFFVAFPIASFKLFGSTNFEKNFVSPVSNVLSSGEASSTEDFSRAGNWFPTATSPAQKTISLSSYFLSIPKLGIKEAIVSTQNDDLFKNLVHYGGSALPGEPGNAVIFGHSTLPQFFDPKNYKTIFSTLHTLKIGDEITASVDGVTYKYIIFNIKVIDPENVSVLEQQYDNSYLTLITCTPPGTYWKRLVIIAQLENLGL